MAAEAGHEVRLASGFRSFDGEGCPKRQRQLRAAGAAEAERLIAGYRADAATRPALWFTYHLYHKAPDWLGPRIAEALAIPYVVAEPSFAPKRAGGPWDIGHRAVPGALARADAALCLTRLDMACVAPQLAAPERLHYLPPFLDAVPASPLDRDVGPPKLIAVGMMRPGDKLESYRRLGAALFAADRAIVIAATLAR